MAVEIYDTDMRLAFGCICSLETLFSLLSPAEGSLKVLEPLCAE
jgi:hypothetical protein